MNDSNPRSVDAPMKFGLLLEAAEQNQRMAEASLECLRSHTEGLDAVVRDELRRSLCEQLVELTAELRRAEHAVRTLTRAANLRALSWSVNLVILCTVIPCLIARSILPSDKEIASMKSDQERLSGNIKRLEESGGRIEWRHCGEMNRLCVRVDRAAPTFGDAADYFIAKGY